MVDFLLIEKFFILCLDILPVCQAALLCLIPQGSLQRVSDSLGLELQVAVGAGIQTQVLWKSSHCP